MKSNLFLIFLVVIVFGMVAPASAAGFDWPKNAAPSEIVQALRQEIYNLKTVIANMKSRTKIAAAAYLAVDLSGGKVLLQKNPGKSYPIASVTKLMTAVVALENIDIAEKITLTKEMLSPYGSSPSFFAGANISAKNLLRASLIQSVNDAAESLSYFLGKEKFLALMNQKAKELGMADTVYFDVTGLNPKNHSTAADMVKLLAYINKSHPEILDITRDDNFWLPDAGGKLVKFLNVANFYYVPAFIGGKTGYLVEARQTFAGVFDVGGKPAAIVILRSDNYQSDVFKIIGQLKK
jgi:D-alanyl-D-alanine carboxypeptidase